MTKRIGNIATHVLISFGLSILTLFAIGAIKRLPYTLARDIFSDILTYPGALISSAFYPQGVHTGSGSPGWAYVVIAANILFYTLVWFFIIRIVIIIRTLRSGA